MSKLDLNGTWKLCYSDGIRGKLTHAEQDEIDTTPYFDAVVPGEVHLDLARAGIIPDPYVGLGALAARWVEESFWSYRREFDAPVEALDGKAWLHFGGLDLVAEIKLNGETVGTHENSFYPCRIDVTGKLKAGRNLLVVHIESGLYDVSDKQGDGYIGSPDQKLHKRHWLRKPQCQFAWDWSTRLINVGITGDVTLEWTAAQARVDQFVPLATLSADLKSGAVRGRLFVEGVGEAATAGKLIVSIGELGVMTTVDVEIKPGLHAVEATIAVPSPELWWPVGHGGARLYTVDAKIEIDGVLLGERSARVGFRHIEIDQDKHPDGGRYFIIQINGRPIFAKGANFVPADMIFPAIDRARYEKLTDLALEANFNLLRVWGGGLYESDDFYELCDEKGILVWQEFIYACGRYPMQDIKFFNNVKAEATYQVRRLAEHASLIIWCGNNEMEWGSWNWGYDSGGQVLPDHAFFHLTLPRILSEEDPTRYYQPSSPYSLDVVNPNADETGDQHPWSVGIDGHDWRKYRDMFCRFPNEGGTLGSNSLPTTLECLPEGQQFVGSFAWQQHDNSIAELYLPGVAWDNVNLFTGKDVNKISIEEFVYWSGLLQGEGLREYIDNFRRRMYSTSSAIFWMYNDCWPTTRSWTIVDYRLRRTPSFCPVKRAFAPVSVVVAESGDDIVVYGINEGEEPLPCTVRYGVIRLDGAYPIDRKVGAALPANSSIAVARFPKSEWLGLDATTTESIAFASLECADGVCEVPTRSRLFLPPFKEMKWSAGDVRVRVENGVATFESDVFVWGVCLDLDGDISISDNFFDVFPGIPHSIPWTQAEPPKVLRVGNLV